MMEIWGLDIASVMGVAEGIPGSIPRVYSVKLMREDDTIERACGRAVIWLAERFQVSQPMAIYAEAPVPIGAMRGRTNSKTGSVLIGLYYTLAGVAEARRVPWHSAHVATVRKAVIGQGNLPGDQAKQEVMRVTKLLGCTPGSYDEADAAALWFYASSLYKIGVCT